MLPRTLFRSYALFPAAAAAAGEELALFPALANLILQVLILSSLPTSLPTIIISCIAKMAIGMWQLFGVTQEKWFCVIVETDAGVSCMGLRHALYVLKLIHQQELHHFSRFFRILSHFATQISTSNGNAPSSPI